MYRKESSSYHKRAKITCSLLSSSSFPRIFRYIILISLSLFFFTIFYLNSIAKHKTFSENNNNVNGENENTSHFPFETPDAGVLKGHTYIELLRLKSTWIPTSYSNAPVAIIIIHTNQKDNKNFGKQLDAIFSQTLRPETVWITTSVEKEEKVNKLLREKRLTNSVKVYATDIDNSGPFAYLQIAKQIQTKYILLLNSGVILGNQYLQNMLYVSNTKEYGNKLLGTMGANLNNIPNSAEEVSLTCYEDNLSSYSTYSNNGMIKYSRTSKHVDMLTNIWFLRKEWLPILFKENKKDAINLPLEFLISFSLRHHSNIPSILLPTLNKESRGDVHSTSIQTVTCNNLRQEFSSDISWKHYIERGYPLVIKEFSNKNKIMLILDGTYQEKYFRSLYCKLSLAKNNLISVITTGNDRGLDASELKKIIKNERSSCGHIDVYDIGIQTDNFNIGDQTHHDVEHMIEYLKPEILIYAKVTKNPVTQGISSAIERFNAEKREENTNTITVIKLPLEEIEYVTELIIDLPFSALKKWNEPKIQLQLITQNRPDSLSRLINSLNTSYYFGDDDISLTVNMDRGADPVTIEFCSKFLWNHGSKNVRRRVVQGGLLPAVIESYYPYDYNHYGILLEDDVELSPFYYLWVKYTILKYRYGPDKHLSQRLFGISLYGQRQMELNMIGRRPYNPESIFRGTKFPVRSPYLSQIPCSWGAVYFPEVWREFHEYLSERLDDETKYHLQNIIVPDSRSSVKWKKSWKKYFIELVYLRGYVMLYPNFKNFTSFSTNHAEVGIHMHLRKGKPNPATIFGVPLMKEFTLYNELPNNHLTDFIELPVTDLWGNLTTFNDLIDRGIKLHNQISQCPPHFNEEKDQLNFNAKDILCVDEEKKRIAINDYSRSEKKDRAVLSAFKTWSERQDIQVNPLKLLTELVQRGSEPSLTTTVDSPIIT